ncbi:MAG: recombinase family protein [Blastocatellia bacterium]|nr:recombinase family protein [Blastocatellia bacterium]
MSNENHFRTAVAARKLAVSASTIRTWIAQHRIEFLVVGKEKRIPQAEIVRTKLERGAKIALYACVPHLRRADLDRHVAELTFWAETQSQGVPYKIYAELGVSSNTQRRKLDTLLNDVENQKVARIVCLYKDCLLLGDSFFLEQLLERSGVELVVVNPGRTYATHAEVAAAMAKVFSPFLDEANPKAIKADLRNALPGKKAD